MYDRAHVVRPQEGRFGDDEATTRLTRMRTEGTATYEDIIRRRLYGSPAEVVDRLAEYQETIGITGVSMTVNPGGQIPFDRVVNSIRLIMDHLSESIVAGRSSLPKKFDEPDRGDEPKAIPSIRIGNVSIIR